MRALFDFAPDMDLVLTNPCTLKPMKNAAQVVSLRPVFVCCLCMASCVYPCSAARPCGVIYIVLVHVVLVCVVMGSKRPALVLSWARSGLESCTQLHASSPWSVAVPLVRGPWSRWSVVALVQSYWSVASLMRPCHRVVNVAPLSINSSILIFQGRGLTH